MGPLQKRIITCVELLKEATKDMPPTMTTAIIRDYGRDPYLILISCLLSLRAKDTMTYPVSVSLFERARTPQEMMLLSLEELEKLFYSVGFFRTKARRVKEVSQELLTRFNGVVPDSLEALLSIKGIGRKTANLVLGAAFEIPAICVDTHVHRLANRFGWIETTTPEQTEQELMRLVPKELWIDLNTYLVQWGQNVRVPISPHCSLCVLSPHCSEVGVTQSR